MNLKQEIKEFNMDIDLDRQAFYLMNFKSVFFFLNNEKGDFPDLKFHSHLHFFEKNISYIISLTQLISSRF